MELFFMPPVVNTMDSVNLIDFKSIQTLISEDMQNVNSLIQRRLHSEVALVNQLSHYIIASGGKRLRPMLSLLAARACGYTGDKHINIATIIEFIHTATLLHDDVVDESDMRRGKETANTIWGNQAAVLVGDFLYSRSFEMMVDIGEMRVMEILAQTTNIIAEGEVLQLLNCNDPDTNEARYLEVIHSKTAKLFEAACQLGAVLAGLSVEEEKAIAKYGIHLGTAFQLVDDILDYSASASEMGKNMGDDLAEGKPTLPLIIALERSSGEDALLIRTAIKEGGLDKINEIMLIIEQTKALDYSAQIAKNEVKKANACLSCLVDTPYKKALESLAWFSIKRTH